MALAALPAVQIRALDAFLARSGQASDLKIDVHRCGVSGYVFAGGEVCPGCTDGCGVEGEDESALPGLQVLLVGQRDAGQGIVSWSGEVSGPGVEGGDVGEDGFHDEQVYE